MKLYATTTSHLTGKKAGIGGSEKDVLIIELMKGNKVISRITYDNEGILVLVEGKEVLDYKLKGNKQKGECEEGGNHFTVREGNEEICRKCLKTI